MRAGSSDGAAEEEDLPAHAAAFATLTAAERRLAFYAKVYDPGLRRFSISLTDLERWRRLLPAAVEVEYERIEGGELPRVLSLGRVLAIAAEARAAARTARQPSSPSGAVPKTAAKSLIRDPGTAWPHGRSGGVGP